MKTLKDMFLEFAKKYGLQTEVFRAEAENAPDILRICFSCQHGDFQGSALCGEGRLFVFLVSMKLETGEAKQSVLFKKLMELNARLKLGSFYVDMATGAVCYRLTHYILSDDAESQSLLESLIVYAGRAAERYYPELAAVLADGNGETS